jgi:DNA-binding winged helix-turn-helix (wHTH) protein
VETSGSIRVGELEVRTHEHVVAVAGAEVPLSPREFEIVRMLTEHPGWVLSADQLAQDPDEGDYSPESISVLISRIRHKLIEAGACDLVETVRGVGYRIHPNPAAPHSTVPIDDATSELRDASWQLQEAVIQVEHDGSPEELRATTELLRRTCQTIADREAD